MNLEPKYYYPWSQIKQNQPTKQDINKKYKQIADQFINSQHPDLKRSINKQIQDYTTESNDNTKVNNVQHRQYNQHLKQRTIAGAKSNALWEKEHPTLSTLGYTAAAAPFVVASAPALIPAGDALAGSAVGNGISSILTNPYFNAVITASGGADAANKIYHGEYSKSPIQDAFTAMEVIPLASQTLRFSNGYNPISSYIKGNYRFLKDHGLSKAAEDIDMERYVPQKLQQSVNTQVGNVINQNIHKRLRDYRLGRIIKDASLKFDGTVGESYFKSPDKWYRITEYPEVQGIREVGQNVTTSDARDQAFDVPANNWRIRAMNIKDYNDNLTKSHNFSLRKKGSTHGNTSQASKGIPWQGTIADSRGQFPSGILEGQARQQEFMGLNRKTFVPTNWEEIPHGKRLGFHTGEMPLDNLTFFKKLPNGRYSFEPVIPNKIGFYNPIKEVYPTTSLKFYENSQKISDAEKLGIPK